MHACVQTCVQAHVQAHVQVHVHVHAGTLHVTWKLEVHIGTFFCLPWLLGSFDRTGVGAGGLGTFWGELFGGKYYMFEKSFFSPFLGGRKFRACLQPALDRPNSGGHQDQHPRGCFVPQKGP